MFGLLGTCRNCLGHAAKSQRVALSIREPEKSPQSLFVWSRGPPKPIILPGRSGFQKPYTSASSALQEAQNTPRKPIVKRQISRRDHLEDQGLLKTVRAIATAESYNLANHSGLNKGADWESLAPGASFVRYEGGEVYIFSNGCYVTWGLDQDQSDRFLVERIQAIQSCEKGVYDEPEIEELDYFVQDDSPTRMQGDIIALAGDRWGGVPLSEHEDILARMALSHGIARSSKLAQLESQLDSFLGSVSEVPTNLYMTGKIPLSRKEIVSKIGMLLFLRQSLNLSDSTNFLDLPEIYWDQPELEGYYRDMSKCLSIVSRLSICNQKINYASEVQSTLRGVLTENTSHRLEWIIIWLIAVEVTLALINYGSHWLDYDNTVASEAERRPASS